MKSIFKFIVYVCNENCPSSDSFKLIINIYDLELARKFFAMQGFYVSPEDLAPFITARQLARLKTFYNKPRHYDLFILSIRSYKSTF